MKLNNYYFIKKILYYLFLKIFNLNNKINKNN